MDASLIFLQVLSLDVVLTLYTYMQIYQTHQQYFTSSPKTLKSHLFTVFWNEGCPIRQIRNRPPNWWRFVTDLNDPSLFVSSQHDGNQALSSTPIRMFVGTLFWNEEYLLHFFCLFTCVVCRSSWSLTNRHPFWQVVTDQVCWTCMFEMHPNTVFLGWYY